MLKQKLLGETKVKEWVILYQKPCKSNVGYEKVFLRGGEGGERGLKPFLKIKTTVLSKS